MRNWKAGVEKPGKASKVIRGDQAAQALQERAGLRLAATVQAAAPGQARRGGLLLLLYCLSSC